MDERCHQTATKVVNMQRYKYVGTETHLIQHTALGQVRDGVFKVQVDNFVHPWSHGWHETPRTDWCEYDGEVVT